MENDEKEESFSMYSKDMKKLSEIANPLKGTAIETILETKKALEKYANPFKGTAFEESLKAQKRLKELTNPFGSEPIQKMIQQSEAQRELIEKLNLISKYHSPISFHTDKISDAITAPGLVGLKMFHTILQNGTIINKPVWHTLGGSSVFQHVELYKNYEDEDIEQKEEPIELLEPQSPIIKLDDTIKIQQLIKSVYSDNKQLYKIHPFEFEDMIAELLRARGFLVELTKRTRDGGKDMIALHDPGGLGVNRYLVECKRWSESRPVSVGVVRSFCYTVNDEKANKGIIFTSSYFTADAYKLKEKQKNLLDFKDGVAVLDWISEYLKVKVY